MRYTIIFFLLLSVTILSNPFKLDEGHFDTITDIDKYPFGNIAITVSHDESIVIWDFSQNKIVNMIELGDGLLSAVAISPGGNYFVVGSERGQIFLYDFNTQNMISSDKIHKGKVTDIVFSENEKIFFTSSTDGNIMQYDIEKKNIVKGVSFPSQVICMGISLESKQIAAGTENGHIFILNTEDISSFETISSAHKDWVTGLTFSPDGTKLASVGWDFKLNIFDTSNKNLIKSLAVNTDKPLNCVDWSSDNKLIAIGSSDFNIYAYNPENYEFIHAFRNGHNGKITGVKFFPDSNVLLSIASDAQVNYWNTINKKLEKIYTGY